MGAIVNRGVAIANAAAKCTHCGGEGSLRRRGYCGCVLRAVFRICWDQYKYSAENGISLNRCCVMEISRGGKILTGLPHAEFVADFERAVARALTPARRKLFELHFAGGLAWYDCLAKLRLDRGQFFHEVYRVEEAIGAECLKGLYPLDQYFGVRRVVAMPSAGAAGSGPEVQRFHRQPLMAAA